MKKVLSAVLFLCIIISSVAVVYADNIENIFNGEQEYLILGTVKDITDTTIVVTADNTVGEKVPSISGKDIKIKKFMYSYCDEHTPDSFNSPKIGDNIFASVSKNENDYVVVNGAYKVDSSDIKNCSTLVHQDMRTEDCLEDAVKLAYFVRSNGKITDFKTGSDGKIYAISEKDEVLVYPLVGNQQCIKFVDNNGEFIDETVHEDVIPIVPPNDAKDFPSSNKWIWASAIFVVGALLGFLVMFIFYSRRKL